MKREETLLRAIGGVDDDLIAAAMEPRKKKRPTLIRWAAVAACVCLMLTVTVGAAKWGVDWWHDQDERYGKYTVDWRYPLAPVEVRQEAVTELEKWVRWAWGVDHRQEDGKWATWPDSDYIGAYLDSASKLRTIADLEEYLGIELTTSTAIDADCLAVPEAIDLIGLTELICDAELEYTKTGKVSPGGIQAEINLGYRGTNCKARLMIFIPLTQNFVDDFPAKTYWHNTIAGPTWSEIENGHFEVKELTISGKDVVVFSEPVDDLKNSATAMAVYSDGGIGYYLYCMAEDWEGHKNRSNVYGHGEERLMELLEGLE